MGARALAYLAPIKVVRAHSSPLLEELLESTVGQLWFSVTDVKGDLTAFKGVRVARV